jgi:hypothetical protein
MMQRQASTCIYESWLRQSEGIGDVGQCQVMVDLDHMPTKTASGRSLRAQNLLRHFASTLDGVDVHVLGNISL